jgi:hypothetical protein
VLSANHVTADAGSSRHGCPSIRSAEFGSGEEQLGPLGAAASAPIRPAMPAPTIAMPFATALRPRPREEVFASEFKTVEISLQPSRPPSSAPSIREEPRSTPPRSGASSPPGPRDPRDWHALARHRRDTELIVTLQSRRLRTPGCEPVGGDAVHPDGFLLELHDFTSPSRSRSASKSTQEDR